MKKNIFLSVLFLSFTCLGIESKDNSTPKQNYFYNPLEKFKETFSPPAQHLSALMFSSVFAVLGLYPLDYLKTLKQNQNPYQKSASFYKGMSASFARQVFRSGVYMFGLSNLPNLLQKSCYEKLGYQMNIYEKNILSAFIWMGADLIFFHPLDRIKVYSITSSNPNSKTWQLMFDQVWKQPTLFSKIQFLYKGGVLNGVKQFLGKLDNFIWNEIRIGNHAEYKNSFLLNTFFILSTSFMQALINTAIQMPADMIKTKYQSMQHNGESYQKIFRQVCKQDKTQFWAGSSYRIILHVIYNAYTFLVLKWCNENLDPMTKPKEYWIT